MNREYSDEEIVEIVKAFKLYIKKIVKHSAIDFIRISKKNKYKEISEKLHCLVQFLLFLSL